MAIYPPLLNPEEDGPSLPLLFVTLRLLNPWETRRATDLDILGALRALKPIRRCATDAAVIGIAILFGVWSDLIALAGSRPVYVCLQTIYGLNSGVFLPTLLHMPYPNRGLVWRSVQSVFTCLLPRLLLIFLFPRICASVCCVLSAHHRNMDCFFPRRDANRSTVAL